ncbi:DUF3472 domain-containing protein [Lutibacter sp. A80]|uniref:DUF3472 domain-containing protein n=1 Tax=Lutibacter sp. A80 TaxID=2918453 RepID=UPI001F0685D0|nr:DUF3472 domain-containing protein [Lutibacter sp. A80]UMB60293.1 DUF3472 domain-containing protein [Lutibacter sp. A80]
MKKNLDISLIIVYLYSVVILVTSCSKNNQDSPIIEEPTPPVTEEPEQSEGPTTDDLIIFIPCEGNSWVVDNPTATKNMVVEGGIKNWSNTTDKIRTYFYATATGDIDVGLNAKFTGTTKLKVTLGNVSKEISFEASSTTIKHVIATFNITEIGYHYVELEGVSKTGNTFGEISDIILGDTVWTSHIDYVEADWFYWGRRGPSVHLKFDEPAGKDITWFYNEITVPEGSDPIGSYFMANGFSSGYFGMQVNSETERRILFSVWSAYDTQDPSQIPKEYTVLPLGYGEGVTVGEFGNEGSGAQSYFVYDWKPDVTYKFLLKGESNAENSIDYTAYFYAPEIGDWKLIASFRRPFPTGAHLTGLHSFLENFETKTGSLTRKANYSNQWMYDTEGNWSEATSAKFTIDNTGASGVRFDYDGGSEGDSFYLRNCGFFSDNKKANTQFIRPSEGVTPIIDFSALEVPELPVEASYTYLDSASWSVIEYSSQEDNGGEGTTGLAKDIIDGDITTYWHSCWVGDCTATSPHYIIVDMGMLKSVDGFGFVQRQSLSRTVKDIEIQVSTDNLTWESLGDFSIDKTIVTQNINVNNTKAFRYFKFIAKSSHDGTENAAMAEIKAYIFD